MSLHHLSSHRQTTDQATTILLCFAGEVFYRNELDGSTNPSVVWLSGNRVFGTKKREKRGTKEALQSQSVIAFSKGDQGFMTVSNSIGMILGEA